MFDRSIQPCLFDAIESFPPGGRFDKVSGETVIYPLCCYWSRLHRRLSRMSLERDRIACCPQFGRAPLQSSDLSNRIGTITRYRRPSEVTGSVQFSQSMPSPSWSKRLGRWWSGGFAAVARPPKVRHAPIQARLGACASLSAALMVSQCSSLG